MLKETPVKSLLKYMLNSAQVIEIDDNIPEEELDGMDVKGYFIKSGWLTLELGESIAKEEM